MRTIAYYISDYGFGHAARSIALIRSIIRMYPNIKVFICCSFAMNFIRDSLRNEDSNRISYRQVINDFGYILKENSIEVDISRMNQEYDKFVNETHDYIQKESFFINQAKVDLVISDISYLPFLAAKKSNRLSIGISNFTWYTAYKDVIEKEKLHLLFQAYSQMDYFIPLAGSNEPIWNGSIDRPSRFFSREINQERVSGIREELNPDNKNFLVFFGLGMKIGMDNLSELKIWSSDNCRFIVSGNIHVNGDNIFRIPNCETETQNYIAACDLIISKPGWGTASEAIQSGKPLLVLDRSNMREDQNMIEYLLSNHLGRVMTWSDLHYFQITDSFKNEMKNITKQIKFTDNNVVLEQIAMKIMECLSPL